MYIIIGVLLGMWVGGLMCSIAYSRCTDTRGDKYVYCGSCKEKVMRKYVPNGLMVLFKGGECRSCKEPIKSCWFICELIVMISTVVIVTENWRLLNAIIAEGISVGALVNIAQNLSITLIYIILGFIGVQEWFCKSYKLCVYNRYGNSYNIVNNCIMSSLCIICAGVQLYQTYMALNYDVTISKSILISQLVITGVFYIILILMCLININEMWKILSLGAICSSCGMSGVINAVTYSLVLFCIDSLIRYRISAHKKKRKHTELSVSNINEPSVLYLYIGFIMQLVIKLISLNF